MRYKICENGIRIDMPTKTVGAVACQLTDYIFPGSIPMSRVNWEAKSDYEYIQNYKLLQAAFSKHHIQRYIDVNKLIKAKYQDNLEFCQWLKAFFDQSGVLREDYDAAAVRAKGKGGAKALDFFGKTASKYNSKPVPTRARTRTAPRSAGGAKPSRMTGTTRSPSKLSAKHGSPSNGTSGGDAELKKKNSDLKAKVDDLEATLAEVEKERDFYFDKLRNVEIMLQVHQEKGEDSDPDKLVEKVFKVLYAAIEDGIAVDDEGEVSVFPAGIPCATSNTKRGACFSSSKGLWKVTTPSLMNRDVGALLLLRGQGDPD